MTAEQNNHEQKSTSADRSRLLTAVIAVICLVLLSTVLVTCYVIYGSRDLTPQISAEIERTADYTGFNDALIVLDGAEDVSRGNGAYGSRYVNYQLTEPHPATEALREIASQLEKKGWVPMSDDWLNPGLPSLHVRGWQEHGDATLTPMQHVHQWSGQWKDKKGNVVEYTLRYSYAEGGAPDLNNLWIDATWFPPAAVQIVTMR